MEEVRSGHDEEPEAAPPAREGGDGGLGRADGRAGGGYPNAVVSLAAPDGFPFSVRAAHRRGPDAAAPSRRRAGGGAAPPGLACVTAHDHARASPSSGTSRCAATPRATAAGR